MNLAAIHALLGIKVRNNSKNTVKRPLMFLSNWGVLNCWFPKPLPFEKFKGSFKKRPFLLKHGSILPKSAISPQIKKENWSGLIAALI